MVLGESILRRREEKLLARVREEMREEVREEARAEAREEVFAQVEEAVARIRDTATSEQLEEIDRIIQEVRRERRQNSR